LPPKGLQVGTVDFAVAALSGVVASAAPTSLYPASDPTSREPFHVASGRHRERIEHFAVGQAARNSDGARDASATVARVVVTSGTPAAVIAYPTATIALLDRFGAAAALPLRMELDGVGGGSYFEGDRTAKLIIAPGLQAATCTARFLVGHSITGKLSRNACKSLASTTVRRPSLRAFGGLPCRSCRGRDRIAPSLPQRCTQCGQ
jgi:hypothetical protein